MPPLDALDLRQFQTPAVRHLAWLCHAPQLIQDASVFEPARYLPENYLVMLQAWDTHPTKRPDILNSPPHYRLGYYVESLYACLITDLLGWTILAKNLPVRAGGTTLGELDFVLHNPHTNAVEHHEIAIKFYLGFPGSAAHLPGWYGPNPDDRLDIKTARMLGPQTRRALLPETLDVLAQHGIEAPAISRVFMPGYLFYQWMQSSGTVTPYRVAPGVAAPASCPAHHLRGQWLALDKLGKIDTGTWVPLIKPSWLGPCIQPQSPDSTHTTHAFTDIMTTQTPRLFASLQPDPYTGLWIETHRIFVVPPQWPGKPLCSPADST